MGVDRLPIRILNDAGLELLPGEVRPREGRAWLVGWQGTRGVLRQLPVPVVSETVLTQDVVWLHGFLTRLAGLGFPSPWPLRCFHGQSWTIADGLLWEVVSFLPGHTIGWSAVPPMEEVGALLGHYHATVRQIEVTSQRPGTLPLADVPEVLFSHCLDVVPLEERAAIRHLAVQLARDLDGTGI